MYFHFERITTMLIVIAFICFSLLVVAWLVAPGPAPATIPTALGMASVPETGSSPA